MGVVVSNLQRAVPVPERRLRRIANLSLNALGRSDAEVHVAVVNDRTIRRLNAKYRKVRRRTDVLAFPLESPGPWALLGEVVVSAEACRRQARRLRVPVGLELDLMVVHGLLHLAGYDDRDPLEARLMHRRARAMLEKISAAIPARLWAGLFQP